MLSHGEREIALTGMVITVDSNMIEQLVIKSNGMAGENWLYESVLLASFYNYLKIIFFWELTIAQYTLALHKRQVPLSCLTVRMLARELPCHLTVYR